MTRTLLCVTLWVANDAGSVQAASLRVAPFSLDTGDSGTVIGDNDLDGEARLKGTAPDIRSSEAPEPRKIWYMAPQGLATGTDGRSWANAFTNITDLLAVAQSGEEVWFLGGTHVWTSRRVFLPGNLKFYGGFAGTESSEADRSGASTVISGTGFWLQGDVWFDGISIRDASNSRASPPSSTGNEGAAFQAYGGNVTLLNGRFENNTAGLRGGVGFFENTSLVVSNCVFADNFLVSILGPGFGSSLATVGGQTTITDCTFNGDGAGGWTILEFYDTNLQFHRNRIEGFVAQRPVVLSASQVRGSILDNRFLGGPRFAFANAIFVGGSNRLDIANNLLFGAKAWPTQPLDVVSLTGIGDVRFINNTIVSNALPALYCNNPALLVANNLIAGNAKGIVVSNAPNTRLLNNNVHQNSPNYVGIADPTGAAGNLSADPLFAGNPAAGDARLQASSPCLQAGDSSVVIGALDIDGLPRIEGEHVDIGASEYARPAAPVLALRRDPLTLEWEAEANVAYQVWISADLIRWSAWRSVEATPNPRTVTVPVDVSTHISYFQLSR